MKIPFIGAIVLLLGISSTVFAQSEEDESLERKLTETMASNMDANSNLNTQDFSDDAAGEDQD